MFLEGEVERLKKREGREGGGGREEEGGEEESRFVLPFFLPSVPLSSSEVEDET